MMRNDENWSATQVVYIVTWDSRREKLVRRTSLQALLTSHFKYIRWYKRIIRRWISRIGASLRSVANITEQQFGWTADATLGFSMEALRESAEQILHSLEEHDRITMEQLRLAPAADDIPGPPEESSEQG